MNSVNGFSLACKCRTTKIIKCQLHWNECASTKVCVGVSVAVPLNAMTAFKIHSDVEFNRQMDYIETKILLSK